MGSLLEDAVQAQEELGSRGVPRLWGNVHVLQRCWQLSWVQQAVPCTAPQESGCFQRGSRKGHGAGVLEKEWDRRECRLFPHLLRSTADKTLPWPLRKGLIAAEFSFLRAESHFLPAEPC